MRYVLAIILVLLSGCASMQKAPPAMVLPPEIRFVEKDIYIIRQPPAELLAIPDPVQDIDLESATQRTVAEWVLKKESRTQQLEQNIKALGDFLTRPISESEKKPTK